MGRFERPGSLEAGQAAIELELAKRARRRAAFWRRVEVTPTLAGGWCGWPARLSPGCAVTLLVLSLAFVGVMLVCSGLLTGW